MGIAALAVALVVVASFLWIRRHEATPSAAVREPTPAETSEPQAYLELPSGRTNTPEDSAPRPAPQFPSELFDPKRYEGLARLEVHLVMPEGRAVPQRWTLSLEPAVAMVGREHAVSRRIEFEDGRAQAVVEDVKLGAYSVRALADGLQGEAKEIELAKPDEVDVVIGLRLYEFGFLTGRVVDDQGQPIPRIPVTIEGAGARFELVTDGDGVYVARDLADGDYRVIVGRVDAPLASADDVSFAAPSLHMPDLVAPFVGELVVRVVDREGTPIGGALVEGSGLPSGAVKVESDAEGLARAPLCSAGRVHLLVSHASLGSASLPADFDPRHPAEIRVQIGP